MMMMMMMVMMMMMIVPGMFNEATGAYAPTETMWEDQYTSRTDDDDDDSLLDDYVNQ